MLIIFNNTDRLGDHAYNETRQAIDFPYTTQDFYPGKSEYLSANFYFLFRSPIKGSLTFYMSVDDYFAMYIGNFSSFIL